MCLDISRGNPLEIDLNLLLSTTSCSKDSPLKILGVNVYQISRSLVGKPWQQGCGQCKKETELERNKSLEFRNGLPFFNHNQSIKSKILNSKLFCEFIIKSIGSRRDGSIHRLWTALYWAGRERYSYHKDALNNMIDCHQSEGKNLICIDIRVNSINPSQIDLKQS